MPANGTHIRCIHRLRRGLEFRFHICANRGLFYGFVPSTEKSMSGRLYAITVLAGALTWAMFGMSLGMLLQTFDAGLTPSLLEVVMVGLWLLMGAGDVWWLLRFGTVRPIPRADRAAPDA